MAWTDTIFQWMGYGRYNASPPVLSDGQPSELQVDAAGRLIVSVADDHATAIGATRDIPVSASNGSVVRAYASKLLELLGHSESDTEYYLMAFDAVSIPSDGAVPKQSFRIPASCPCFSFTFYDVPVAYSTGLCWAASSTAMTLTRASAAKLFFETVALLCLDTLVVAAAALGVAALRLPPRIRLRSMTLAPLAPPRPTLMATTPTRAWLL